jgi:hypothetical protein
MTDQGVALVAVNPDAFSEARIVADAWTRHVGKVSEPIRDMLDAGRYLDAAIELAKVLIGSPLIGWKLRFTSSGGPYEVELLLDDGWQSPIGQSDQALTIAFVEAISNWRRSRADRAKLSMP